MSVVISKFYGAEIKEWVANANLNDNTEVLSIDNLPAIESDEQVILEYIEQRLVVAFEV